MKIEDIQDVIYEKEENGICTATINAPKRKNAMSFVTFLELVTILDDMEADKNARVLIITGKGDDFSSGGYFNMNLLSQLPEEILNQIDLEDIAQKRLCIRFWEFSKPVIGLPFSGLTILITMFVPKGSALDIMRVSK